MDLGNELIGWLKTTTYGDLRNPEIRPKDESGVLVPIENKIYDGISIEEWIAVEPDKSSGNVTISVNADVGIENSNYHGKEGGYDDHDVIIIISSFDKSNLKMYTELTKNLLNLYYGDIENVYIMNSVLTDQFYKKNSDLESAFSTLVFQMRKRI